MSSNEVEALRQQISELRERVVKLETYIKVMGAFATLTPLAIQVWSLLRK